MILVQVSTNMLEIEGEIVRTKPTELGIQAQNRSFELQIWHRGLPYRLNLGVY